MKTFLIIMALIIVSIMIYMFIDGSEIINACNNRSDKSWAYEDCIRCNMRYSSYEGFYDYDDLVEHGCEY